MLPPFDSRGILPPGIHAASWQEFVERFGATKRRQFLLQGLKAALTELRSAGCRYVYINGSFVTDVPEPNDVDCVLLQGLAYNPTSPAALELALESAPGVALRSRFWGAEAASL